MADIDSPFPEFGASTDPKVVPWHTAVVWSDRTEGGKRIYEWLPKSEIRSVSWTSGLLSIQIHGDSVLDRDLAYILIQAPFITVGKHVPL